MRKDEFLDFDVFKCPSDVGYKSGLDGIQGAYLGMGVHYKDEKSFFDNLGNSYATDSTLIVTLGTEEVRSFGPYLRRYSSIPNTGKVVVYEEGDAFDTHFWNNPIYPGTKAELKMGWHGILRRHKGA